MDRAEVERLVRDAVNMLFACDAALLGNDNSEWAIAHRLAVYLEQLLPGWNIDCEFNRQGDENDPKALESGSRVRPDIIVHHRGQVEREHNLLAIELKKSDAVADHVKVKEYTSAPAGSRTFQYQYGLSVSVPSFEVTWFESGRIVSQLRTAADANRRVSALQVIPSSRRGSRR